MTYLPASETSVLVRAVQWIEAVMLGPVATAVAVLAIASLGLVMRTGRLSVRRGLTALLGCFITFGAASIAQGISGLARSADPPPPAVAKLAPAFEASSPAKQPAKIERDPYAGASLRN